MLWEESTLKIKLMVLSSTRLMAAPCTCPKVEMRQSKYTMLLFWLLWWMMNGKPSSWSNPLIGSSLNLGWVWANAKSTHPLLGSSSSNWTTSPLLISSWSTEKQLYKDYDSFKKWNLTAFSGHFLQKGPSNWLDIGSIRLPSLHKRVSRTWRRGNIVSNRLNSCPKMSKVRFLIGEKDFIRNLRPIIVFRQAEATIRPTCRGHCSQ